MQNQEAITFLTGDFEEDRVQGVAVLACIDGDRFLEEDAFLEEVFGPFSLLVECENQEQLEQVVKALPGQLTTTLIAEGSDFTQYATLFDRAEDIAGRMIVNGVPTGVEVCDSQHHGGPFPATTDGRFGAVGADALKRFARPVAYQNFPEDMLPEELKSDNPLNINRQETK